jgi:DNA-binding transcriptional LysR family regulator
MAAPGLLAAHGVDPARPETLPDELLVHGWWWSSIAAYPTWRDWFAEVGAPREPAPERGHAVGMSGVALDFAIGGVGVVLGQKFLAVPDLAGGALEAPFGRPTPLRHPYAMVIPRPRLQRKAVRRLVDWLTEEARAMAVAADLDAV